MTINSEKNKHINRVVILMAMEEEALPVINKFNLVQTNIFDDALPMNAYQGKFQDMEIFIVTNGKCQIYGVDRVGTQPAAIATWEVIRMLSPDLIINAGTAGGFKKYGVEICDVYVADVVKYHDRRIPLQDYDQYGIGSFACIETPNLIETLKLKVGTISTGNSLDLSETDAIHINKNNGVVKEMEAAAIGEVTHLKKIPFMAVKSITDFVEEPEKTVELFLKNFAAATQVLADKLFEIISFMHNKKLSAL